MIAVVDYCKGNLKSVERGLRYSGGDALITDDPRTIARARAIVLPGVGAFADAAATMETSGQMEVIRSRIRAGVPFLGICLGLHLLFDEGVEGAEASAAGAGAAHVRPQTVRGLGVLPGTVVRMPAVDAQGRLYKVPHVGWNSLEQSSWGGEAWEAWEACALLRGISPGEHFYFTHSYIAPHSPYTVAVTTHAGTFPSVVSFQGTVFGVQFHPEKSSDAGAQVLRNFLALTERS